jgi:DNA repair protein RadC
LIFQGAIKTNASGIIVCHNHPSGNAFPSDSDRKITQKIKEAGNLMDIQLLDHLIILPVEGYFSFADDGNI